MKLFQYAFVILFLSGNSFAMKQNSNDMLDDSGSEHLLDGYCKSEIYEIVGCLLNNNGDVNIKSEDKDIPLDLNQIKKLISHMLKK